ncbi:MAG: hypothetical protein NC203_05270 [Firmicutes bacterium]|nr:hypothetical protein [[Eubacterium] siraeum]MCM1487761.1 hypothetical protein [Bacillota bacterium]
MKKRILLIIFPAAALILMLIPFGMPVVQSGGGPNISFKTQSSYFSGFQWGMLNLAAPLTVICNVILLFFAVPYALSANKSLGRATRISTVICAALAVTAMAYGMSMWIDGYTFISIAVSLLLIGEIVLSRRLKKEDQGW